MQNFICAWRLKAPVFSSIQSLSTNEYHIRMSSCKIGEKNMGEMNKQIFQMLQPGVCVLGQFESLGKVCKRRRCTVWTLKGGSFHTPNNQKQTDKTHDVEE